MDNNTQRAQQIRAMRNKDILNTINEFFTIGGPEHHIENMTDLLKEVFVNYDAYELDENSKPTYRYLTLSPEYLIEKIYMTCDAIKFIAQLGSNFEAFREFGGMEQFENNGLQS
ncbi:hypothetical protein [Mucilaginibacter sp. NFR10]|uniref:hypothetical protein n=1 Tax=Mucilaginibacter sp. NFR10 TaxID=1566292 RepID=UPI000871447D|nr:hypothetical protein [Mucilaginibacter sp. NFR10]SCW88366.1 hypothetical protein SAMN03159284_05377 [Mucilaginibacter sp. NFR10]